MGQEPSKVYGRHQDAWTEPVYRSRDQERNKSLLKWTNREITKLTKKGFFKDDFNKELKPYFGKEIKASDIVIDK
ncbi:ABC transporter substrate-binding protein [Ligilactobacillus ruminis]|uniref:ABC transporter substrate-binding protein n=1 Tax=Ligilactobacillus ruminis TaxID=1623 RepID=A0A837IU35_9LACO|nr:ABC transporter substrate-binding protein [Ligilactobacillus ruminis]